MSDLSISAANIGSGSLRLQNLLAGEDISIGEPYYFSSTSGVVSAYVASNTGVSDARAKGVAYEAGTEGTYFLGVSRGPLNFGTPLTKGATYYLSDTSGITTFEHITGYLTEIGWAQTTGELYIDVNARGIQI